MDGVVEEMEEMEEMELMELMDGVMDWMEQ